MEIVSIGLLLAVVVPAALGLENKYIPPALPEYTLQSLEEYPDTSSSSPAHTFDQDGYRYRVGRIIRHKREALQSADNIYADYRHGSQNLPDSNFIGPSPDEIAVPSFGGAREDSYQGPSPEAIARPSTASLSILQPFQQAFIESTVLTANGYQYRTVPQYV